MTEESAMRSFAALRMTEGVAQDDRRICNEILRCAQDDRRGRSACPFDRLRVRMTWGAKNDLRQCHSEGAKRPKNLYISYHPSLKSFHSGFIVSIKAIFLFRSHPFICFSLWIAA